MTKSNVTRESNATAFSKGKDRPIIITVYPKSGYISMRLKGLRGTKDITIGGLFHKLAWAEATKC